MKLKKKWGEIRETVERRKEEMGGGGGESAPADAKQVHGMVRNKDCKRKTYE